MSTLPPPYLLPDPPMVGEYVYIPDLNGVKRIPGVKSAVVSVGQQNQIDVTAWGDISRRYIAGRPDPPTITLEYMTANGLDAEVTLVGMGNGLFIIKQFEISISVDGGRPTTSFRMKVDPKGGDPVIEVKPIEEEKIDLFPPEEEEQLPKPISKITGKQAAMLRARAREAGFATDKAFLEWLEYESKLDVMADMVEDIDAPMMDDILAKLNARR